MASTLPKGKCAFCGCKENVSRCVACKAVQYCSRDDQIIDRSSHKEACNRIKKTRKTLEEEERKLRAQQGGMFLPENVFETMAGYFWGLLETRPYMRARYAHIETLLKVKTFEAVQVALEHLMDLHRLCRTDNMGVRDLTPHCLLRLGRDQECYDFIKWYATTGRGGNYDWRNMDLPFLDVKNADIFEPLDLYIGGWRGELSHIVAVTLIKIKLLTDLKALQNSTMVGGNFPKELLDNIRGQLVSTIAAENKTIMDREDQRPQIEQLQEQIDQLYRPLTDRTSTSGLP